MKNCAILHASFCDLLNPHKMLLIEKLERCQEKDFSKSFVIIIRHGFLMYVNQLHYTLIFSEGDDEKESEERQFEA